MAEPIRVPLEEEMQDSITLSAAPQLGPRSNNSSANSAGFFEAEVPASPTYSISSISSLSTISDLDLYYDSEPPSPSSAVKTDAADSMSDDLEDTANDTKEEESVLKNINLSQNVRHTSRVRVRGIDICADPDTVEAFRVARAIAAIEGSGFGIAESRQLRSSSKVSCENKTLSNHSNGDYMEISRKRGRLSSGSDNYPQVEASSTKNPATTILLSSNPIPIGKKPKLDSAQVSYPDHALSLETPPPRKKSVRKKKSTWSWAEYEDESPPEEPVKRHSSLPPGYSIQQFSFRADFPSDSDKSSIRQSRALSEGADKPRDPTPIVPMIVRKTGILSGTKITPGRLRPRKEPSTLGSHRLLKSISNSIVPKKRLIENGARINITTGSSQTRPLADITNKFRIEGEKAEKLTPKRQKLNSGAKGGQNCGGLTGSSSIAANDNSERIETDALTLVDGVYMTPKTCHGCLKKHQSCDKKTPCDRCIKGGSQCTRDEGLVPVRNKAAKTKTVQNGDENECFSSAPDPPSSHKKLARSTLKPLNEIPQLPSGIQNSTGPRTKRCRVKREVTNRPQNENASREISVIPRDPQADKPPGIRRPAIWCESRQELCESLTYYRSYQGGVYGHDGLVLGSLLDGFPSPRDYIDGKVAIAHTGGKSGTDEDGNRRLLSSQTRDDKTIQYLLRNLRDKSPMVLIIGKNCGNSPSKIPHTYCVMDWFKVTAGWAEKDQATGFARWKFRFEKLDTTTDGWWASQPSIESEHPEEMVLGTCRACKNESPHIYEEGWMCLDQNCSQFWKIDGENAPAGLKYTQNFINCRTPWPLENSKPPSDLAPILDETRDIYYNGEDVSRIYWKGMCCPKCGRLNCRELWAGWRCLSCDYTNNPPRTIFSATSLANPHRPIFTGPAVPTNKSHPDIVYKRFVVDGMTVMQYEFGDCGTVSHILSNKQTNSRPKGADWLLDNYQSIDMPFKRFPMQNHKSRGRLLTQQFSFNCGAPYKFIAKVDSTPFDQSPLVVTQALDLVTEISRLVHHDAEFNEILSVGYFEGQKMDFHDDGEAGLGETVASISLGAPARMKFRLKKRYIKDTHLWTTKPPALLQHDNLNMDEEEPEEEENEDLPDLQQKSPARISKDNSRVKLDLCLNHGDVMVMSGSDIQKYWEHSVIPLGKFRVAATARFIHPTHAGVLEQNIRDMDAAGALNAGSDSIPLHPEPSSGIQQISEPSKNGRDHIKDENNDSSAIQLNPEPLDSTQQVTMPIANGLDSEASDIATAIANSNNVYEKAQGFPKFLTEGIFHPVDIPVQMVDSPFVTSFFDRMDTSEQSEFLNSRKLPELPEHRHI